MVLRQFNGGELRKELQRLRESGDAEGAFNKANELTLNAVRGLPKGRTGVEEKMGTVELANALDDLRLAHKVKIEYITALSSADPSSTGADYARNLQTVQNALALSQQQTAKMLRIGERILSKKLREDFFVLR